MQTSRSKGIGHLLLAAAGFAVLFGWLWAYAPLHGGYVADSDLYEEYLPTFLSPLTWWSSFEFGGAPSFASPSESMWYLPHLFFRDVVGSLPAYVASANVIAALGAYLCIFALTRSRAAALFAGLAYGLSEGVMERVSHLATMHTVAWFPWVVWSVDRLHQDRPWRAMAVSALVVATFLFAGNPQSFLYGAYACLAYALAGGIAQKAGWRFYAAGVGAVVLGGLLTAVATLPMLELSTLTARQTMNLAQFTRGSLDMPQLFSFVYPTILHDGRGTPTYIGLLTLIFAFASLRHLFSDWRIACWTAIALAVILISVGDMTPVAKIAYELPFYDRFRIATRHLYIASFAFTLLAGLAIARLQQRQLSVTAVAGGATALLVLLAAGAWAMAAWPTRFEFDDLIALPWKLPIWEGIIWIQCGIGLVAAALAILFARTPRSNGLLVLLLVVLAADMVYALPYDVTPYGVETVVLPKEAALNPSVHAQRLAATLVDGQQRVLAPAGTQVDAVVPAAFARLWRIPIAGGYNSMMLGRYQRLALMGNNGSVDPRLFADQDVALNAMATKYLFVHEEDLSVSDTFDRDGITWNSESFDLPIGSEECHRSSNAQVTMGLPADTAVRSVLIVAHLACAENVVQGDAVATIRLRAPDGSVIERPMIAGVDVSEGGLSDPAIQEKARHQPATIFDGDAGGNTYLMRIDLPTPAPGDLLTFSTNEGSGRLVIDRITLLDGGGTSLPQNLQALLLSNTERWSVAARFATSRETDRGGDDSPSGEERYVVYENLRALPRAWVVRQTVALDEGDADIALHSSLLPDGRRFNPADTALIEGAAADTKSYSPGDTFIHVRPVQDSLIRVDVFLAAPAFLVLSENLYPGWEAAVDRVSVPVRLVDGALMGVEVPAGRHEVTFRLRSPSVRWGAAITLLTLVVVAGVWWKSPPVLQPRG